MIAIFFSPFEEDVLENDTELDFHVRLQGIGFYCAKSGITSEAEESNNPPTWESISSLHQAPDPLHHVSLHQRVQFQNGPTKLLWRKNCGGAFLPDGSALWKQQNRAAWEQESYAHLSRWSDGKLEISELWRDPETGSAVRQERIERWLEAGDGLGRRSAVCAHIHGC